MVEVQWIMIYKHHLLYIMNGMISNYTNVTSSSINTETPGEVALDYKLETPGMDEGAV